MVQKWNRVQFFKEDKKGIMVMCRAMENMRNKTSLETARQLAICLLIRGKDTYEQAS